MIRLVVAMFILYFAMILWGYTNTASVQADRFKQTVAATVAAQPPQERPVIEVTRLVAVLPPEPPTGFEVVPEFPSQPVLDKTSPIIERRALSKDKSAPSQPEVPTVEKVTVAVSQTEQSVLDLINQARSQAGLAPLQLSPELVSAASRHSQDMGTHNLTWHTGSDGSTFQTRIDAAGYTGAAVNEAIFYGSPTPTEPVNWWLGDEHHRPILLSDAYSEIGISHVEVPNSQQRHYWTLTFGKPSGIGGPTTTDGRIPGLTEQDGPPQITVAEEYVNVRSGPGIGYATLGMAQGGQNYLIVGKSRGGEWWQVCCFADQEAWIIAKFVQTSGNLGGVEEIVAPPAFVSSVAQALQVEEQPLQLDDKNRLPVKDWLFDLELTAQHVEANTATIYGFVHDNNNSLDGYFFRVVKDGVAMPNDVRSAALALGTTKPGNPSSPENKIYNIKQDFNTMSHPDFNPVGQWVIQLVDGAGQPIGPAATFTLSSTSQQMEMYVRYQKR